MMTNIDRNLKIIAVALVALPVLLLLLIACGVVCEGFLLDDTMLKYVFDNITILALLFIPLALKLMTLRRVRERIADNDYSYFRFSLLRMAMLEILLVLASLGYLFFGESSMLWCFGVGLIAFAFIWPGTDRRLHEQGRDVKDKAGDDSVGENKTDAE